MRLVGQVGRVYIMVYVGYTLGGMSWMGGPSRRGLYLDRLPRFDGLDELDVLDGMSEMDVPSWWDLYHGLGGMSGMEGPCWWGLNLGRLCGWFEWFGWDKWDE